MPKASAKEPSGSAQELIKGLNTSFGDLGSGQQQALKAAEAKNESYKEELNRYVAASQNQAQVKTQLFDRNGQATNPPQSQNPSDIKVSHLSRTDRRSLDGASDGLSNRTSSMEARGLKTRNVKTNNQRAAAAAELKNRAHQASSAAAQPNPAIASGNRNNEAAKVEALKANSANKSTEAARAEVARQADPSKSVEAAKAEAAKQADPSQKIDSAKAELAKVEALKANSANKSAEAARAEVARQADPSKSVEAAKAEADKQTDPSQKADSVRKGESRPNPAHQLESREEAKAEALKGDNPARSIHAARAEVARQADPGKSVDSARADARKQADPSRQQPGQAKAPQVRPGAVHPQSSRDKARASEVAGANLGSQTTRPAAHPGPAPAAQAGKVAPTGATKGARPAQPRSEAGKTDSNSAQTRPDANKPSGQTQPQTRSEASLPAAKHEDAPANPEGARPAADPEARREDVGKQDAAKSDPVAQPTPAATERAGGARRRPPARPGAARP
ncbi:MAG: hypothetical protein AB7S38_43150, partial [Vulcanimicrobiota bacterium]